MSPVSGDIRLPRAQQGLEPQRCDSHLHLVVGCGEAVAVGQDGRGGRRYGLSVNPAERDALQAMLNSDPSRTVTCGGGLMETTPEVLPMAELDFAHFANGGGITSDLVFVNVGTHPILPALYFYDKEGHLIAAESVVEITGALEIQEGRQPKCPDRNGNAGRTHDFNPRARGGRDRIGSGVLGWAHWRGPSL